MKGATSDCDRGRRAENVRLRLDTGALKRLFLAGIPVVVLDFSGDGGPFAGVGAIILKSGGCGGSRGFWSGEIRVSLGGSRGDS